MQANVILERLRPVLGSYRPPGSPFESGGGWEHTYELFSAPLGPLWTNGELHLKREVGVGGGCRLSVNSRRRGSPGYSFFVQAEFECGPGLPPPLVRWTASSKLAAAAGDPPFRNSGLNKHGRAGRGALEVRCGGQVVRTRLPGVCMAKWCLIDAVQRLPREGHPVGFSLLDEVDEVRHGQELRYRGEEQVVLGGVPQTLAVYEHLGTGVIPTSYWAGENNRVLFVVSGIEIYVLKASNGVPAAYSLDNPKPQPL